MILITKNETNTFFFIKYVQYSHTSAGNVIFSKFLEKKMYAKVYDFLKKYIGIGIESLQIMRYQC